MRILPMLLLGLSLPAAPAAAATLVGTPDDYRAQVAKLAPGDMLQLAPGVYRDRLPLSGKHGDAAAWIVVCGPDAGTATFTGVRGYNTVDLSDCSFVAVKNIAVDCLGLPVDGVNAKGTVAVHDVLLENVKIVNAGANQQIVGINTKCPCWNWTIRGCEIVGAGTGMYLGNSNGEAPFLRGVIEYNRVYDPEGYCLEIKHQNSWPADAPAGVGTTIIRHNVFIKTDRASGSGDRPNLLFGGFPMSGPGGDDRYEVYGNFVASNPRESLIQATGRFTIHDNLLVNASGAKFAGIVATAHQGKSVKHAVVYNNTIYACSRGIRAASGSRIDVAVGNLVFSDDPISGDIALKANNLTAAPSVAGDYVVKPATTLGEMDFSPLPGRCVGDAPQIDAFRADVDFDRDFSGAPKDFSVRGAYARPGGAQAWSPSNALKPRPSVAGP